MEARKYIKPSKLAMSSMAIEMFYGNLNAIKTPKVIKEAKGQFAGC